MQHFLSRVFSSKYGRVAIFVIAVLVIAAAIAGWNGYQDTQENKWACLQRIEYVPKGYHLLDEEKRFATQDEALNYCFLESLSHSQPLNLEDYELSIVGGERSSLSFENQMGFGEALAGATGEVLLQTILFVVFIGGGLVFLHKWAKRYTKNKLLLYANWIAGTTLLFLLFGFVLALINNLTGLTLFM